MEFRAFLLHLLFAAFICSVSAFLTAILISHLKVLDIPNDRSSHSVPVPRGGGLAIVVSFLLGILLIQGVGSTVPLKSIYFWGFLFSLLVIASMSFFDDMHHRGLKVKLGTQLFSIAVAMMAGNVFDLVRLPWLGNVQEQLVLYPLTLIWLLGLTNAYNFMDGLDGMAAATCVVASVFFAYITHQEGSHFTYLVSLTLGAATFGFMIFNWSPAKIFLGDVGSAFLGFAFATLTILAARYDFNHTSLFVMPLLLLHFIFDSIFTFLRRLRSGENVFQAHRTHLYQLINRMGYSHKFVTLSYSALAVIQGIAAMWMVRLSGEQRPWVFFPFVVIYTLAGIHILARARREGLL